MTEEVRAALALAGEGYLMPLVCGDPVEGEAVEWIRRLEASQLFPGAWSAPGALAGLWLYLRHFEECHQVAQQLHTAEGAYWHGILHRQEPDDLNAGYWFRRLGRHPVFEPLAAEAARLAAVRPDAAWLPAPGWVPENFIRFCALARQAPGTEAGLLAREIQQAEWRLLFAWCARVRG